MLQNAFVQRAGTQAATDNKDYLFSGVKAKGSYSILMAYSGIEQLLTNRIACHHDFLCGEETFHALISDTNLGGFLGQQLVGDTCIGVLFLQQTRNTFGCCHIERRTTGIASDTDSYLRTEVLDNLLGHALALPYLVEYLEVLQQILAVKTLNGETYYLIARSRNTLHLHTT